MADDQSDNCSDYKGVNLEELSQGDLDELLQGAESDASAGRQRVDARS